ncbi:MAG: hypothetical protein ACOX0U_00620 [Oscillospiraceae bacterium]|jgi:histidyl-tRNA synthetase
MSREAGRKGKRNTMVQITAAGHQVLSQSKENLRQFGVLVIATPAVEKTARLAGLLNEWNDLIEEKVGNVV